MAFCAASATQDKSPAAMQTSPAKATMFGVLDMLIFLNDAGDFGTQAG
jgi:hypothetical protein